MFKTNNHLLNANKEPCLFSQNPIGSYRLWFMLLWTTFLQLGVEMQEMALGHVGSHLLKVHIRVRNHGKLRGSSYRADFV
jgi:hypothetical protein